MVYLICPLLAPFAPSSESQLCLKAFWSRFAAICDIAIDVASRRNENFTGIHGLSSYAKYFCTAIALTRSAQKRQHRTTE